MTLELGLNPEFKILESQNNEFEILESQNPGFTILEIQDFRGPKRGTWKKDKMAESSSARVPVACEHRRISGCRFSPSGDYNKRLFFYL